MLCQAFSKLHSIREGRLLARLRAPDTSPGAGLLIDGRAPLLEER